MHDLLSDLAFLPEKMKINKHDKLACTLYDKEKYIAHIRNIKQALNDGLKLQKVRKAIALFQLGWVKFTTPPTFFHNFFLTYARKPKHFYVNQFLLETLC